MSRKQAVPAVDTFMRNQNCLPRAALRELQQQFNAGTDGEEGEWLDQEEELDLEEVDEVEFFARFAD